MSRLEHKRGRKSNYVKSLNNDYWKEVCQTVRIRDKHKCQRCGKAYPLEVHHNTYTVKGVSIRGNEKLHLDCLTLLCSFCHQLEHKRKK